MFVRFCLMNFGFGKFLENSFKEFNILLSKIKRKSFLTDNRKFTLFEIETSKYKADITITHFELNLIFFNNRNNSNNLEKMVI